MVREKFFPLIAVCVVICLTACSNGSAVQSTSETQSGSARQSISATPQSTGSHDYTLSKTINWQGFTFKVDDQNWKVPKNFEETPKEATIRHDIDFDSGAVEGLYKSHNCYMQVYSATHGQTKTVESAWDGFKSKIEDQAPVLMESWEENGIEYSIGAAEYKTGSADWYLTCYDPATTHGMAIRFHLGADWSRDDQLELVKNIASTASYDNPSETTYDAFDSRAEYYKQVNNKPSNTSGSGSTGGNTSNTTSQTTIPAEYRSALNKAQSYSDKMHMSKARLYDQLTSEYGEKFSAEAAQYAVDNVKADWNANALATARSYQQKMDMSPAAIYDQLTSEYGEKFTAEEAQYAVDNL